MVAERGRRVAEDLHRVALLLRRARIFARARPLERISARLDFAAQIAGLPRDAREVFELVVIRLEFVVGDAPIGRRAIIAHDARAVTRDRTAARLEVPRQEAPRY